MHDKTYRTLLHVEYNLALGVVVAVAVVEAGLQRRGIHFHVQDAFLTSDFVVVFPTEFDETLFAGGGSQHGRSLVGRSLFGD